MLLTIYIVYKKWKSVEFFLFTFTAAPLYVGPVKIYILKIVKA